MSENKGMVREALAQMLADQLEAAKRENEGLQRDLYENQCETKELQLLNERQRRELSALNRVMAHRKFAHRRRWMTLNAVYMLHRPLVTGNASLCTGCGSDWPCKTLRVIRGESIEEEENA